jgi:hypothetical protein
MPKNPLEMSNREWREELARINRDGFIQRTRALDKAETEAAYARIMKRSPGWQPTPLPDPDDLEDIEDVAPEDVVATLSQLRQPQSESEE